MGNRQGTATSKSRKSETANDDRKRSAISGDDTNPSTSAASEPEKKKRCRSDNRKKKESGKSNKTTKKESKEVKPDAAASTTGVEDVPAATTNVLRGKPAELIDEGTRHQDHQLPELITTTTLTADDEDNNDSKPGTGEGSGSGNGNGGEANSDDNGGAKKQLQLTIYRSYSSGVEGVSPSVSSRAGGVVVQRAAPRLDDVKIYRRSRGGLEAAAVAAEPAPETGVSGNDAAGIVASAAQSQDNDGTPSSRSSAEVGIYCLHNSH